MSELIQGSADKKVQLIAPEYAKYSSEFMSRNTRIGYRSDLSHFISWGGSVPCTPHIVSMYLANYAAHLSPSTLARHLVAIGWAHKMNNHPSPTDSDLVKATLKGIKRSHGSEQRQVSPILKNELIEMISGLTGIKGFRDQALLLLGFAGAFRRSELVGIDYEDIEFVEQGVLVYLSRTKTDQLGAGRKVAIPYARGAHCPVLALKLWLNQSRIDNGPIFRPVSRHGIIGGNRLSTQAVAVIIKERAQAIGLDATNYSGHSLRAGLVTSAAQAGVSTWKIKQQTGHKSDAMLDRYIRTARIFMDNAAAEIL